MKTNMKKITVLLTIAVIAQLIVVLRKSFDVLNVIALLSSLSALWIALKSEREKLNPKEPE